MPYAADELLQEAHNPRPNTYRDAPMNVVGKVITRHADGTIDVSLNSGGMLTHVLVCSPVLSTDSGSFYIPKNDLATQGTSAQGTYEPPTPATGRNIYCLVEFAANPFTRLPNSRMPFVRTFLPPDNVRFIGEEGLAYAGHESGVYETIDTEGNKQVNFPDGSWLSIGPTTTQKDMTKVSDNWVQPTGGQTVNLVFHHSSGTVLEVTTTGEFNISNSPKISFNNGTKGVSGVGDSVQITGTDSAGDTFTATGTITSGSSTVYVD